MRNSTLVRVMAVMLHFVAFTAFAQSTVQYQVIQTDFDMVIDGVLDEPVWALASETPDFVVLGTDDNALTRTWSKLLWDETYLYVGFYCEDTAIYATYKERDDPLYKEDVVEIYLDPDSDEENYLEIEVNPKNTVFDLWLTKPRKLGGVADVSWTMDGFLSGSTHEGIINFNSNRDSIWFCEMALPFHEMEFCAPSMNFPPQVSDSWLMNLYRFDRSLTNDPKGEATGWSQTDGGQHEPWNFGTISFAGFLSGYEDAYQTETRTKLFKLDQNYPNPFHRHTIFQYSVNESSNIVLTIFDQAGREVMNLTNKDHQPGIYTISMNGSELPAGLYFAKMVAGFSQQTIKLIKY